MNRAYGTQDIFMLFVRGMPHRDPFGKFRG